MTRSVAAARRLAVTVVGSIVLAAGLAMLVLPGPGLLGTAAGLAILATEYEWARKRVVRVRQQAHHMSQVAGANVRNVVMSLLAGVVLLAAGIVLLAGPDLLPVGQTPAGVGLVVGGGCVVVGTVLGHWEHRRLVRELRSRPERVRSG